MKLYNHPVLCNYYVTYRCNARCTFCDIWQRPSPYAKVEDVEKNLIALKKLKVKVIDFTGGEPLLHRQLPTLLKKAKELGFITTVTTNTLLYPKYAKALQGLVDMLHFSLDFATPERHNALRGVPCYDFVMKSIQIALSLNEHPDILFTVTNENIHELPQVYELCKKYGLILIINPVFSYNQVGKPLTKENVLKLYSWLNKPWVYLNKAFLDLRLKGGNAIDDPVCVAGDAVVVISPDNRLILPCYHAGWYAFPIQDDLYSLWHKPEVVKIRKKAGRLKVCQGCVINCYMEPSFAFQINRYFWYSLPSTFKYIYYKWWKQRLAS